MTPVRVLVRMVVLVALAGVVTGADAGHALDPDVVGDLGDPSRLVIRGARTVSAEEIRAAVAGSVNLLPSRQETMPWAVWSGSLSAAVLDGYRADGFRDARVRAGVEGGAMVLDVVEGERTRCGVLGITAPDALKAIIAGALSATIAAPAILMTSAAAPGPGMPGAEYPEDLDPAPVPGVPDWRPGWPMDWRDGALPGMARDVQMALRGAGYAGATVAVSALPSGPVADLAVSVGGSPVALRLGAVRIIGIPDDQAATLRAWLALPADAPADDELVERVRGRLRDRGRYVQYQVDWEDDGARALAPGQTVADWTAAFATAEAPIAARGRCDLLIAVTPCPAVAMFATRVWDGVLAARAASLARLRSGRSAAVIEWTMAGARDRLTWAPGHGLLLEVHGRTATAAAALVAVPAGYSANASAAAPAIAASAADVAGAWLVASGHGLLGSTGGGIWTLPVSGLDISYQLVQLDDASGITDHKRFAFNSQGLFRVHAIIDTASCCEFVLGSSDGWTCDPPRWDGAVLVLRQSAGGAVRTYRADPVQGLSCEWSDGGGGSFHVVDQDWDAVMPAAARAVADGRGTGAAGADAALRPANAGDVFDVCALLGVQMPRPLRTVLAPFPLGEVLQPLIAGIFPASSAANGDPAFTIPDDRVPATVPLSAFLCARAALVGEGLLAGMDAHAWPRRLLRAAAITSGGAGAASLRPLFDDPDIGPVAFLACASAARIVGIAPLVSAYAEAGLAHCDADGLAAEARACAGMSDRLLTIMGAAADGLAQDETEPRRAADLRRLARACGSADRSPARLEALARSAADLGVAEWLRARLQACDAAAATQP